MNKNIISNSNHNSYLSLTDSKALYGIAILLMIFHHCFAVPSRIFYDYVSVFGVNNELKTAYFGKICVGIYAFITGYGLSQKSKGIKEDNVFKRIKLNILISKKQIINFYLRYWLVFVIFIPIGICFFNSNKSVKDILFGFIFGRGGYNNEWWYVLYYVLFLLLYPFLELSDYLFEKFRKKTKLIILMIICAICVIISVTPIFDIIINKYNSNYNYFIVFISGFLIGKKSIYEIIDEKLKINKPICLALILLIFILKFIFIKNPNHSFSDIFSTPVFVFAFAKVIKGRKKLTGFLCYLGKYSIFMWLTHTFWLYYYFQNIVFAAKYSILIYVWTVVLSLATAIIISFVYEKIYKLFFEKLNFGRLK